MVAIIQYVFLAVTCVMVSMLVCLICVGIQQGIHQIDCSRRLRKAEELAKQLPASMSTEYLLKEGFLNVRSGGNIVNADGYRLMTSPVLTPYLDVDEDSITGDKVLINRVTNEHTPLTSDFIKRWADVDKD